MILRDKIEALIIESTKGIYGDYYNDIENQILQKLTTRAIAELSKKFFFISIEKIDTDDVYQQSSRELLSIETIDNEEYQIFNRIRAGFTNFEINVYVNHKVATEDFIARFPDQEFNAHEIVAKVANDIATSLYDSRESLNFQKANNISIFPTKLKFMNLTEIESDNGSVERMMFRIKVYSKEITTYREKIVKTINTSFQKYSLKNT
jgi:hypothetical protein